MLANILLTSFFVSHSCGHNFVQQFTVYSLPIQSCATPPTSLASSSMTTASSSPPSKRDSSLFRWGRSIHSCSTLRNMSCCGLRGKASCAMLTVDIVRILAGRWGWQVGEVSTFLYVLLHFLCISNRPYEILCNERRKWFRNCCTYK